MNSYRGIGLRSLAPKLPDQKQLIPLRPRSGTWPEDIAYDAIAELRRAAELAPKQPRYAYVYAVALNSIGRFNDAIAVLKHSLAYHSLDRETLFALATFNRDAGKIAAALDYAKRLVKAFPTDKKAKMLLEELQK